MSINSVSNGYSWFDGFRFTWTRPSPRFSGHVDKENNKTNTNKQTSKKKERNKNLTKTNKQNKNSSKKQTTTTKQNKQTNNNQNNNNKQTNKQTILQICFSVCETFSFTPHANDSSIATLSPGGRVTMTDTLFLWCMTVQSA